MFSLSVRSLDGTSRQIDVEPETTLADIQARLEEQLPAFREVRLVELQILTVQSPAKAVSELERLISEGISFLRDNADDGRGFYWFWDSEAREGMLAAAEALGNMQEFPPDVGERLLQLLDGPFFFAMNPHGGRDIARSLAATFGCKCGDPSPHVATLVDYLEDEVFFTQYIGAVAGVEIAERLGDALPGSLRETLIRWSSEAVTYLYDGEDPEDSSVDDVDVEVESGLFVCACRLIGLLGGDECTVSLQHVINRCLSPRHKIAAAEALDSICSRRSSKATCAAAAASQEPGHEEFGDDVVQESRAAAIESENIAVQRVIVDTRTEENDDVPATDKEEELAHDDSRENSAAAIEFENSAVQKAIVDTKEVESNDSVVILRLNRHADADSVVNALEEAPALLEVRSRILDSQRELRPPWAGGAWVLIPMACEIFAEGMVRPDGLSHEHVLMMRKDEQAVRDALKKVWRAMRPQLSLAQFKRQKLEPDHHHVCAEADPFYVVVDRTFITARPQTSEAADRRSAPVGSSRQSLSTK